MMVHACIPSVFGSLHAEARVTNHCSVCGEEGHNRQLHDGGLSRSVQAGQLVYEGGLSFAEAGRRVGVTRQAAHQGWRRYVQHRSRPDGGICKFA